MQINPHLSFDGRCEEAFVVYERILGGKITMMLPYGKMPGGYQGPPELANRIMHARLVVKGIPIMGADAPPDRYKPAAGFMVNIGVGEPAEAERVFAGLADGGTVVMPMQGTFWAHRFGMLIDKFGIPWMVNCEKAAA